MESFRADISTQDIYSMEHECYFLNRNADWCFMLNLSDLLVYHKVNFHFLIVQDVS
jgi:hypothetical protein